MGRFGDWAKGPWRETVRVAVAYIVRDGDDETRHEIITTIPRKSLDFHRDAADRILAILSQTVRPPKLFRITSTTVEGGTPFIHPKDSW